jgi:hypothetical protein
MYPILYVWNYPSACLVFFLLDEALQQEEDQTNTKDNIPIEEATERKPYGLRIF